MVILTKDINNTSINENGYFVQLMKGNKEVSINHGRAALSSNNGHTVRLINRNFNKCSAELKIGPHYSKRLLVTGRSCRVVGSVEHAINETISSHSGHLTCSFSPSLDQTRSLKFVIKSYLQDSSEFVFRIDDLTDISTVMDLRASVVHSLRLSHPHVDTSNFDILHTTFPSPRLQGQQGIETVFSHDDDDKELHQFGFLENEERTYRLCLVNLKLFQIVGFDDSIIYEKSFIPSVSQLVMDLPQICLYTEAGRLILSTQWGDLKNFTESILFFLRVEELTNGDTLRLYSRSEDSYIPDLIHVYVRTRSDVRRLIPTLDTAMPLCLVAHKLRQKMTLLSEITTSRNRLIFNGIQLPKSGTIKECKIKPGNLLFLVPILYGIPDYHDIVTVMDSKSDKMSFNSFDFEKSTLVGMEISKRKFSEDLSYNDDFREMTYI